MPKNSPGALSAPEYTGTQDFVRLWTQKLGPLRLKSCTESITNLKCTMAPPICPWKNGSESGARLVNNPPYSKSLYRMYLYNCSIFRWGFIYEPCYEGRRARINLFLKSPANILGFLDPQHFVGFHSLQAIWLEPQNPGFLRGIERNGEPGCTESQRLYKGFGHNRCSRKSPGALRAPERIRHNILKGLPHKCQRIRPARLARRNTQEHKTLYGYGHRSLVH